MDEAVLIRDAECAGRRLDVQIDEDRISALGDRLTPRRGEEILEAQGGALIPGLHDHHVHLLSLAAAFASVACGPPEVETEDQLHLALEAGALCPQTGWMRGTGYFESVAGPLDRDVLDRLAPDFPLRIQHRSGIYWFLNSRALEALDLERGEIPDGVERDARGRPTGRLFRADDWLRERLQTPPNLDLAEVGRRLSAFGITGVTDATPTNGPAEFALFREARRSGSLPQRLWIMGERALEKESSDAGLRVGAHKIMLDDALLPDFEDLAQRIADAHDSGRAVAIHVVTRGEILFALGALHAAGSIEGDRLEHASVTPPEALQSARQLGLRIVTQPHFVRERGDAYLEDVDAIDQAFLYRLQDWCEAGVALGGGSDAPFGNPDPWLSMRAAVERRTRSERPLGQDQALSPEQALALFTSAGEDPGGPARAIDVGALADLCLLDRPWSEVRQQLDARRVRATLVAGQRVWQAASALSAR